MCCLKYLPGHQYIQCRYRSQIPLKSTIRAGIKCRVIPYRHSSLLIICNGAKDRSVDSWTRPSGSRTRPEGGGAERLKQLLPDGCNNQSTVCATTHHQKVKIKFRRINVIRYSTAENKVLVTGWYYRSGANSMVIYPALNSDWPQIRGVIDDAVPDL